MLTLQTNKRIYRFCSYCRSRMIVMRETASLLVAHCPKYDESDKRHEVIWQQDQGSPSFPHDVYRYLRDTFMPGMGAKEGA